MAAAYQIPPPAPMALKGEVTENWKEFENAWQYYSIATELDTKLTLANDQPNEAGKKQVAAILCSVMGSACLKIMNSIPTLTAADKKDPEWILEELHAHFTPQRNVLYERFKFNTAYQQEETANE